MRTQRIKVPTIKPLEQHFILQGLSVRILQTSHI